MVEHHGQHRLASARDLRGLQNKILILVIGAARNPHLADSLAHILDFAVLQKTPRLDHLFVVFGQNALVDDEILVKHALPSFFAYLS